MEAEEFWDKNAEKYSKSAVKNEEIYQLKLIKTQEFLSADAKVLEFGCGTGSTALHHAPHVKEILGTDISSRMVEIAQTKAKESGQENAFFEQATFESFTGEPGSYDAILALNLLHLLDDPPAAIRKAYDLLNPGGVFVTGTACLGDVWLSPYRVLIPLMRLAGKAPPVHYVKRKQLMADFENAGFEVAYEMPKAKGQAAFIILKKPAQG